MPYVGNQPAANFSSVTKDTFDGGDTSGASSVSVYTLSKAATTNGVAVFVENVRQEPTTAYSVSGTTLTFTGTTPSGTNNVYVLHHNAPASTANHPAGQDLTAVNGTFTSGLTVASNVNITNGDIIFGTSGNGINLGVTSNTDSNTLDDYEEGTYTIAMTAASSGTLTLNSSFNTGYYTKIGDIVTVTGNPKISSVSSPNGNTLISLPFTVKNQSLSNAVGPMFEAGVTYQTNQRGGFMVLTTENTTTMTILYNTDGDFFGLQAQNAGFGANDQFRFSVTYKVE